MSTRLLTHFDNLMGDPCSGFALAIALHIASGFLLRFAHEQMGSIRSFAAIAAGVAFLLLSCIEYVIYGPDWLTISVTVAMKAWIVYSVICITGTLWSVSLRNLELARARLQRYFTPRPTQKRSTPAAPSVAHSPQPAPDPPPAPEPPPPTLEEKAAALRTRFSRCKEEIHMMPIPDDEKEARIKYLKAQLDEQLNRLFEDIWS